MSITFEEYDEQSQETAIYPAIHDNLPIYPTLKLAGEAGEFSEKVGKLIRDKGGKCSPADQQELLKELGDVLWYIAACARDLDSSIGEVAEMNLDKLKSRASRGKIQGSGDNR